MENYLEIQMRHMISSQALHNIGYGCKKPHIRISIYRERYNVRIIEILEKYADNSSGFLLLIIKTIRSTGLIKIKAYY